MVPVAANDLKGMGMGKQVPTTIALLLATIYAARPCWAQEEVEFADPNLQRLVESHLNPKEHTSPTPEAMRSLTTIGEPYLLFKPRLRDLKGLEHAINLGELYLGADRRKPGGIRDLWALSEMKDLEDLELQYHQIEDIQVLSKLEKLKSLDMRYNRIMDLSALCDHRELEWLDLRGNPLSSPEYEQQAALIRQNNPSLRFFRDRFRPGQLLIPAIFLAAIVSTSGYHLIRSAKRSHLPAMLCLGIASGAVGCLLGGFAQVLYRGSTLLGPISANGTLNPPWLGPGLGGILGALIGFGYVEILGQIMASGTQGGRLISQAMGRGIVAGILCSTLVHILLMIAYRNLTFRPLVTGAVFGCAAGLILGLFAGVIAAMCAGIRRCEPEETVDHEAAS